MTIEPIPKIFHRIWIGGKPLPEKFARYGQTWLRHHPDWTMMQWTDECLPPMVNRREFAASAVLAGKADILRYELLLQFGGVYLDVDVECLRSIEPILQGIGAFVCREDERMVCNAVMGGRPGHPFFQRLVADLPEAFRANQHPDGRYDAKQSGPPYLTGQVRTLLAESPGAIRVFPPPVFYPYHWTEPWRDGEPFPEAYGVHHWSYSWCKRPVRG